MLSKIFQQINKRPPLITFGILISCLITTIPQFILGMEYSNKVGNTELTNLIYFTLPSFSHEPSVLVTHLVLNFIVLFFFGTIVEVILGRNKFSIITLLTFALTTILIYLRGMPIHGISGVCWGYQIVFIFILVLNFEINGRKVFREKLLYLYIFLLLFNFILYPLLEISLLGIKFGDSFGQFVHLASNIILVPFVFIWRKIIEKTIITVDKENSVNIGLKLPLFIGHLFPLFLVFGITIPGSQRLPISSCLSYGTSLP